MAKPKPPGGGGDGGAPSPTRPGSGDGDSATSLPRHRRTADVADNVARAQETTAQAAQQGRPGRTDGGNTTSARDVHGMDRTGMRGVDIDHVWRNGEMYIQNDGQIVRVLDNGNGTYDVVVRDMGTPSAAPTTVIKAC